MAASCSGVGSCSAMVIWASQKRRRRNKPMKTEGGLGGAQQTTSFLTCDLHVEQDKTARGFEMDLKDDEHECRPRGTTDRIHECVHVDVNTFFSSDSREARGSSPGVSALRGGLRGQSISGPKGGLSPSSCSHLWLEVNSDSEWLSRNQTDWWRTNRRLEDVGLNVPRCSNHDQSRGGGLHETETNHTHAHSQFTVPSPSNIRWGFHFCILKELYFLYFRVQGWTLFVKLSICAIVKRNRGHSWFQSGPSGPTSINQLIELGIY